jgi:hypothetical protein
MKKLVLLSLFIFGLSSYLTAQLSTATVNGTIVDSSGAVVTKAQITVSNPATGFSRQTVSGAAGDYSVTFLPPGTYNMRVQASGFSTVEQKGIQLLVGQVVTVNQTLKPGGAAEVVEVTGEPPMIETSTSTVTGTVSPTEVSSLPLLDRNFSGLESLIPGVRQAEGFDPTKTRVGNISVNGGDGRQVDTNVDGGDNKDLVVGGLVQNFTMEGIQEFNVTTNRYTAEAGHAVSAVVNVVTKSGTDRIHGSAFALFQNSGLNKNDYFSLRTCQETGVPSGNCPKPLFHSYHYGGSIGGPIIKNKLFYFGAFEQKRELPLLTVSSSALPDLTTFAAQTSGFPGGPYAFPVYNLPATYIDTLGTVKLDWTINSSQNIFVRYGGQKWTALNDQVSTSGVFFTDGTQGSNDINNFHDLAFQWNVTISPSKVNSYTAHFQDMANTIPALPTHTFTYPVVGGSTVTNPFIFFADGTSVGLNPNVPQETLIRKYQFADNFTWTHGTHNFKFGANWIYFAKMGGYFYSQLGYTLNFWDDPVCIAAGACPNGSGGVYPQGISTPGAVSEILLNGGSGSTAQPPWSSLGLYFQDDWKVSPRLTLNLGLRWDANADFLQPQLGNSLTTSNKGIWDLRQVMANPNFPTSDPGAQTIEQLVGNTSNLQRTTSDWKEFQPRVGFAWDITGTGKHLLRGGYGIARDQIFQNITLWSIQQSQPTIYQAVFDVSGSTAPGVLDNHGNPCSPSGAQVNPCTFQLGTTPLPTPQPATTDLAFGALPRITSPSITDPWSQQFGIGYAWQINNDYAFSADYVHILGTHEERVINQNPYISDVCNPAYGGNPDNPRCVAGTTTRLMDYAFQQTGVGAGRFIQLYDYSTNNRSFYDGINLQLKRRMSKHFMFQVSDVISWSRSWGGFPVASYGGSGLAITPDQQFAPNEFNYTNFDERNRFVASGVFNLPWKFQLSPIFTAASARPYSFIAGSDVNGDGRHAIDRVCVGSTLADPITTPGCTMIKPNTLRGIPLVQMNLRADKTFQFGERMQLALYWEFYNLFNRANFCNSYEESSRASTFNTPQSFCNGPANAAYNGTVSGYGAAAVGSLTSQFGFRFSF